MVCAFLLFWPCPWAWSSRSIVCIYILRHATQTSALFADDTLFVQPDLSQAFDSLQFNALLKFFVQNWSGLSAKSASLLRWGLLQSHLRFEIFDIFWWCLQKRGTQQGKTHSPTLFSRVVAARLMLLPISGAPEASFRLSPLVRFRFGGSGSWTTPSCSPHHCVGFLFFALHPPHPAAASASARPPTTHTTTHDTALSRSLSHPTPHTALSSLSHQLISQHLALTTHGSHTNSPHTSHIQSHPTHHTALSLSLSHPTPHTALSSLSHQLISQHLALTTHGSHTNSSHTSHIQSHPTHHTALSLSLSHPTPHTALSSLSHQLISQHLALTTHGSHTNSSHTSHIQSHPTHHTALSLSLSHPTPHTAPSSLSHQLISQHLALTTHGSHTNSSHTSHTTHGSHHTALLVRAWAPLSRGWLSCGRRSTQRLLEELVPAWAPLGRGWLPCGKRSTRTRTLLEELVRAWAPLGRGWLSCGRRSTQSLEVLVRAWAPLGRGWLSCGRCSTQSLLEELVRAGAAGPRLAVVWQAQYTEPPGRALGWLSHLLWHTSLSHNIFHTPLCHTSFCTHHLSHTTLSHTIFHTPPFTHTIFHTHTHHLHTPSFTHRHRPSFTQLFTHHLSYTTLSNTIFHTPSFTHHLSSTSSFVFPSFPVPATKFLAHYWKKLTCGVIRSFFIVLHRRSIGAMHSWFHGPSHELRKVLRCFPFAFSGAWCFGFLSSCVFIHLLVPPLPHCGNWCSPLLYPLQPGHCSLLHQQVCVAWPAFTHVWHSCHCFLEVVLVCLASHPVQPPALARSPLHSSDVALGWPGS